ncbi:MAG: secondary thiamine-phosphate synthase enzyme YjbQ, partial [Thiohalomonadales bacterium]
GCYDITEKIKNFINEQSITTGLCYVFIHHTSASLIISENADPAVLTDLETFMAKIAPDGDPAWIHDDEGPDDMPAHIRSVLTQNNLTIPISDGKIALGIWQAIYLWEHRTQQHQRKITITLQS